MFSVHCPGHGTRVLLWPNDVEALHNTPDGIVVWWRCHCGERGATLTGRSAAA